MNRAASVIFFMFCLQTVICLSPDAAEMAQITDKTLVAWVIPANLDQQGTGVLSMLEGDAFDSIVLGEVLKGVWMPGSDHFNRTDTDQKEWPRQERCEMICVAIVYEGNRIRVYRDGGETAGYAIEKPFTFGEKSYALIGQRHAGRGFFAGAIEEARIYDRALSAEEIARLNPAPGDVAGQAGKPIALLTFEDGTPRDEGGRFNGWKCWNGAKIEKGRLILDGKDDYIGPEIDRHSLVKHRERYAETLEEQEAQLKEDAQLARFAASRKAKADDPHRPVYHYVNPEGSLNDPNGLCFWQGRWHLFYQAYPPEDTRQHWGHAVSDDLIHWRDLPLAIYPHPEDKCYSGATLVEEDRVIAMYHGTEAGSMVAVSDDPLLLNWEKVTGQPVIPMRQPGQDALPYNVFDPCIWKESGMYYALTAGTLPEGPGGKQVRAEFLHCSKDLAEWKYLHPFLEDDRYGLVGDDGACPYFWPIGDRHILLHFSHMSGGKYMLGNYDTARQKFVVTWGDDFNFGPAAPCGVHAPSATPDGKGGVIVIFNMNPGKPTRGWNQIMSLPRRLTLVGEEDLHMKPAGDIESLREGHIGLKEVPLPANQDVVMEKISGKSMEIIAEIDTGASPVVEMNVLQSPESEEYTRIAFYRKRGMRDNRRGRHHGRRRHGSLITLDTSRSSVAPDVTCRAPETAPVFLDSDEPLQLRVFVDRSIVEVFVNGKQCVAARVYPDRKDSLGVSFRAQGRDAVIRKLDAWQMKSIYE